MTPKMEIEMGIDLDAHDWGKVMSALQDLKQHTQENEPEAVVFLAAIENVIASLPDC